ncbi:A-kinase anchor protein 8-like isoform X1 [Electrophorus electricus]|uniref:A-kinase anchor protein 8-like isoform X1 n=1 Tax=Electrophorus electricus TaxID=8005 RepID=UPI0015D0300B|nr:A-kinase anchor protein 8-like isoform X1 [Electrophorus electricus]
MDGRGYGTGFSNWGGGGGVGGGGGASNRGSGSYDLYGYKDSMSGGGGYGGGGFAGNGGGGQMKRGLSGASLLSSTGTNADAVIAKINQRLDMLAQLEGGVKGGGRGDRFDQYESYDSRSSALGPRDLYRSGNYGYGDSRGDMMAQRGGMGFGAMGGAGGGGGFDGPAKMRQARDAFTGSGWGAGQRSPRRGGASAGRGFGRRQDSSSMGGGGGRNGGQGPSPSGRGKLPSLLAHRMYPESGAYQPQHGSQDYPVRHFGGGQRANRQRTRKRPLNRQQQQQQQQQQVKPQPEVQKKRKQSLTAADEPESKMGKTELAGEDAATCEPTEPTEPTEEAKEADAPATLESEPVAEGESADLSVKEEDPQLKAKPQGKQTPPPASKLRKRRGFFERSGVKVTAQRVTFACSICKFRSFYSEDMAAHLESKFHKDHFRFLSNQLSKPTTDFLQEYLNNKYKKTEQRVNQMENHSAAICQVLKEQDLTRDIGMEHFMRKVEAAHCAACDMYIPMQYNLIQKHLRSPDHNYNRKGTMEQSKRSSLSVARSILNHKVIGKKLESYLRGENPFIGNQDDQDPEDSMVEVSDPAHEGLKEEEKLEGVEPEGDRAVLEPETIGNREGKQEEEKVKLEKSDRGEEIGGEQQVGEGEGEAEQKELEGTESAEHAEDSGLQQRVEDAGADLGVKE